MLNILGKMAKLQEDMKAVASELNGIEVSGEAGGGMVKVTATAAQRIKSVEIEQALLDAGDPQMLQDLLVAGLNQALEAAAEKAKAHTSEAMQSMLPPGFDPSRFGM